MEAGVASHEFIHLNDSLKEIWIIHSQEMVNKSSSNHDYIIAQGLGIK